METTTSLQLHTQQRGTGEPLVLVHGSWGSHKRWALVEEALAESFRVVTYDRRGHGHSEFGDPSASRRDEENDLAALIEDLGAGPAHVIGNSFGGSVALGMASRRADLVRSVSVHEPPLADLAPDDELVAGALATIDEVVAEIHGGAPEDAARMFVERIALGPGGWAMLPLELQQEMVRNAGAFAREQRAPDARAAELSGLDCPVLITAGQASPAWFAPIVAALQAEVSEAAVLTILGSGHVPHITHPGEYVEVLTRFARSAG